MPSQEFLKREFIHYISDTIGLLGGSDEIIHLIRNAEEKPFTPHLIDEIRKYNCIQIEYTKSRLAILNTTTFRTKN